MKKINNMTVTVTYTVSLSDVEVPDNVHEGLMDRYEFCDDDFCLSENEIQAFDWLVTHIEERDAVAWKYEVDID